MRYQGTWLLTIGTLGATLATSSSSSTEKNILEVDLVFPQNKTYKPTEWFPIVFGFQNPQRAQYLNIDLTYSFHPHETNTQNDTITLFHDLRWENWSSHDPYFAHNFLDNFNSPGRWNLAWTVAWQSCDEEGFENRLMTSDMLTNQTDFSIWFTIAAKDAENEGIDADLVSATSGETSCPDLGFETAIAINVTEKTMSVPDFVDWSAADWTNHTCSVVAPTLVIPDPCRVKLDQTVVESIQASLTARRCQGLNPPDDCPEKEDNESAGVALPGSGLLMLALSGALGLFASM
ncbi:hypothetical protein AN6969.2 [Aspergillus nidulans FGSC A4]|uniref:DUF7136 domain-containing protein n=1 Tax=Emericella nidulans (strain FGSC A4 / ATCC 38163 / CBS 112.46 / NRRL 194 / M139) TaxID=227321 RepID=Q5AXL1_EMENI|nr:hypothetical protein [Aspergillus nidulans FGSC A4]EAA57611.1 hypothetical protein AN6969.2 [Aspergillus nidulans FGSC A4]CBF71854.1 TPA: conserved hypothetical protein [Aspergillus nidulans FGSC A4]|eukprot:XP_664573.1 hypothetical protein AN6969.2 [Aspergillus nidulans FGSC A4]